MPDSCCKAKRAEPMKTTAKYGSYKEIAQKDTCRYHKLNKSKRKREKICTFEIAAIEKLCELHCI